MDFAAIFSVGLMATAIMTVFAYMLSKMRPFSDALVDVLNALVSPERAVYSLIMGLCLHLLAGIFFAGVYWSIFNFLQLDNLRDYMRIGSGIGLAHGFFISFFFWFGDIGYSMEELEPRTAFNLGVLNTCLHVIFGVIIGLGFGLDTVRPEVPGLHAVFNFIGIASIIMLVVMVWLERLKVDTEYNVHQAFKAHKPA